MSIYLAEPGWSGPKKEWDSQKMVKKDHLDSGGKQRLENLRAGFIPALLICTCTVKPLSSKGLQLPK